MESLVSKLLNKYLGDFVDGIDRKSLEISLFKGKVSLTNLSIKPTALDTLFDGQPIRVVSGSIGSINIQASFAHLKSKPVSIVLKNIYLLVKPNSSPNPSSPSASTNKVAQRIKQLALDSKRNKLLKEEETLISHEKKKSASDKANKEDDSFVAKLATRIIDNIQLDIQDIHIRFEDEDEVCQLEFLTHLHFAPIVR